MKNTTNPAPTGLSEAACGWWQRLTAEHSISDSAGKLLLESALRAFDRMNQAAAVIDEHGVVTADKYGQLKPNPACNVERDSRAAMLSALKALNLDLVPLAAVGRPPRI